MAAEEDDLDLDQEDQEDLEPDNAAPTQALPVAPTGASRSPPAPPGQATGGWQPAPGAQPISVASAATSSRQTPGQQPSAGWQPAPDAQPISIANVEPKKTEGVSLKDYGKAAWASTLELGQDLLGASSFAARKIAESPELVTAAETARHQLADHMAGVVSSMSPDAQKAFHSSLFGGSDTNGQHTPTPGEVGWSRYAGMTLASFIPDAVMLVLPGGVVGKAVEKTLVSPAIRTAAKAGDLAAQALVKAGEGVAQATSAATTGASFGAQMAGSAYNHIIDEVDRAKPEEMASSPVYAHAREQGVSDIDAKRLVVDKFTPYFAAQFALGAATGAGAGQLLTKGAMGAAGASTGRRMAIGAAEGAGTMAAQAGGGNALEQAASINAGTRKEFDPSETARALASGALGGALLGAGGGLLHGRGVPEQAGRTPPEEEQLALPPPNPALPPPDHVSPEQNAALQLALPKPETTYGPETPAWTRAGEGLIPGSGSFTTRPSDGRVPTPEPEPGQRQLPPPATGYGEGFTMPPRGTPAVPTDTALPAPEARTLLPPTDRSRGEGFVTSPSADTSPAKPSGGMNRGNLVEQLTQLGRDPKELRRMKIDELRSAFDEAKAQPEPAKQEFRPSTAMADQNAGLGKVPVRGDQQVDRQSVDQAPAEPIVVQKEKPTVGDQLKAKRQVEKSRMEETRRDRQRRKDGYTPEMVDFLDRAPTLKEAVGLIKREKEKPTVGDQLKAKRQAQKQRMTSSEAEMSREEYKAALDRGEKFRPATLEQLSPGSGVYVGKSRVVWVDFGASVGRRPFIRANPLPEGVVGLIKHDDVKPRKPETKIDEDIERGEVIPDEEASERRAPSLVEEQPQMVEREGAEPTTVVQLGEARGRSDKTTNLDRKLSDLESDITNGLKTPAEASAEYGKKELAGGRDRTYPDLENYLHERVKELSDETKLQGLIDKAQRLQDDKKLTKEQRNTLTRELNEEMQRRDPEYIQKLKDALDEIRAESKAKGGKALGDLKARLAKKKLTPKGQRTYPMIGSDRLNKPILDLIEQSHDEVRSHSIHDYLDAVIKGPSRIRQPQMMAYAMWLKAHLPKSLRVMAQRTAAVVGGSDEFIRPGESGTFWYEKGRATNDEFIALNPDAANTSLTETLLHEATHALTQHYIDSLQKGSADHRAISAIALEMQQRLTERWDSLSPLEQHTAQYALSAPEELHTMLMTSPVLQRLAAEITPSAEFRGRMADLGYQVGQPKNLWRVFTDWVRRVAGMPSHITDSFLDHIMRPIQDIAERAADYNRGLPREAPSDPVLRQVAATASSAGLLKFNKKDVIDRIDPKGLGDRGRRAVLQGATTDGIVNWNKALFQDGDTNHLENYRKASEASAATSKAFRDQHTDKINDLLTRTNRLDGAEREKLATLMNDATTNEVALGTNRLNANDHLKPGQQRMLSALQARYNGLAREGKTLYNAFRDYYHETYATERSAQLAAMIKTAIPDATRPQVEALAQAAKTMRGIKQLIDNPDASPVAAAFADAWGRNRSLARLVAKAHSQGFVRGDYFPLRRFGDYVVRYGDRGTDNYGVEMFDRRSQAEARRAELVAQGTEPSQVLDKRKSNLRDMLPTTVMDELHAAVEHSTGFSADQAGAVRDMFASILMQHASRSEAARTRLRRQGVQGASKDVTRVLARDYLSLSSRLGYLEHGPERAQALAAMRRHSDLIGRTGEAGEQIRAQAVINELELRQPAGDDGSGTLTGLARKFGTMGYVYSLMSPSHMLTSTIEAHMNSTSLLGARHGFVVSSLQLAKALRETAPLMTATGARKTFKAIGGQLKAADWNLSTVVRDRFIAAGADRARMTDLFNRLNNAGLIDHSMVREMQRIANPSGQYTTKAGDWWGRFMDLNGAMAHAVDVANKTAIAKAAYDLEYRKTGSHDLSAKYAVDTARQTMPNYNFPNKARISTDKGALGGFAGPLTQFKQYGIHMYSMMANLVKTSIDGASKQDRAEARKAFAATLATHALMAGSLTLIADPLRYVMGAYDYFTDASRPHDYQNDVRSWIAEAFGPELGEIVSRGLPHAAGIDIHRRVGLANLLEVPELKEFSKKGFGEMLVAATTGAAGEDATAIAEGLHKMVGDQDIWAGLQLMVPRLVRDAMKASNLSEKGVTDSKGKTILPAKKLSSYDVAAQAAGFQPSRVSEFREGRNSILEAREETRNDRSKAMTSFTAASSSEARKSAIERVRDYNRTHPEEPITYSQLLQAQKRQAEQVASPKTFGLQLPKKQAPSLEKHGSFANSP